MGGPHTHLDRVEMRSSMPRIDFRSEGDEVRKPLGTSREASSYHHDSRPIRRPNVFAINGRRDGWTVGRAASLG